MRTICDKDGKELATVLSRADYMDHNEKRFFSAMSDVIQVGSLFFAQGASVKPHRHLPRQGTGMPIEVLLVLSGSPVAEIYGKGDMMIDSFTLATGDILIQKAGGHAFQFPDKAMLLEIKRGPYCGRAVDKELIGVVT